MIKRLVDIVLSLLGLAVLFPFLLAVSLLIKFYDGGPIFFVQRRVGRKGISFNLLKFRSMVVGGEKGASLTVGRDQRITPPGRLLRNAKIDELPQLLNVLRGEMSLVGPRPEVAKFVDMYTPSQREVLTLKPGITDPASFVFFDEAEMLEKVADPERFYVEQLMVEKIRINLEYARKASMWTDIMLIAATVLRITGLRCDVFSWLGIQLPKIKI